MQQLCRFHYLLQADFPKQDKEVLCKSFIDRHISRELNPKPKSTWVKLFDKVWTDIYHTYHHWANSDGDSYFGMDFEWNRHLTTPLILTIHLQYEIRVLELIRDEGHDPNEEIMESEEVECGDGEYSGWLHEVDYLERPIHFAARESSAATVQILVEWGADPQLRNRDGKTAFEIAKTVKMQKALQTTPAVKPLPGDYPETHKTPFLEAIYRGDLSGVRKQIRLGVDPTKKANSSWYPIHWAARHSTVAVMECLIDAGASLNSIDRHKNTPLHTAIRAGNLETFAFIVCHPDYVEKLRGEKKCGVSLLDLTKGQHTPTIACMRAVLRDVLHADEKLTNIIKKKDWSGLSNLIEGKPLLALKALSILLQELPVGVDTPEIRKTVNKIIKTSGKLEASHQTKQPLVFLVIAKKLNWFIEDLRGKFSTDDRNLNEETPLLYAARFEKVTLTPFLLSDAKALNKQDRNFVHIAADHGNANGIRAFFHLFNNKSVAIFDLGDEKGDTPMHLAARRGHEACIVVLHELGFSLTKKNKYGREPFALATMNAHMNAIAKLYQLHPISIKHQDSYQHTPMHIAAMNGQIASAIFLYSFGANLEALDGKKRTPLHWAARNGHPEMVHQFLAWGAEKSPEDIKKKTPLQLAISHPMKIKKREEIKKLL